MIWSELYGPEREPGWEQIAAYIASPLWTAFCAHLDETHGCALRAPAAKKGGARHGV